MKKLYLFCMILAASGAMTITNAQQDTRPYAPIAIPLPDTLDQLYRDSATIKIGRVRVNQAGYRIGDDKYFYYVGSGASSFSVINVATGASVATGTLTSKNTTVTGQIQIRASNNAQLTGGGDTRYEMQSPAVSGTLYEGRINVSAPGQYRVRVGADTSGPFWIHDNVYGWVRDAAIKFPGVNRCGNTESWFHGACHLRDATPGGWHDCGDHLKEGATQSYLHAMLALASAALRDRDADKYGRNHNSTIQTDGVPDVLYEAKHGSDYIIAAYDNANGRVGSMVTAVGGYDNNWDHSWWGQPENQERMPQDRGGHPRPARVEPGANVLGLFAAGLALTAKNYAVFDAAHAEKSVKVAKDLYEYAKANPTALETGAYYGNKVVHDKLAFAALALLYVTKDKKYLNELCYDKTIGSGYNNYFDDSRFEGGWFAKTENFSKDGANTDWASTHMAVKWAFFRLILKDEQMCADLGITDAERLKLIGRTVNQMLYSISQIASYTGTTARIELPNNGTSGPDANNPTALIYDDIWKSMHIQMAWMWNRYQFGNIFDLFAYSDMAMWLEDEGLTLPGKSAGTNWRGREVRQLMVRQVDYMLGVNPLDLSMIYGVGHKNSNHPHHRAANPEGKNVPGAFYKYRPPVGALHSGASPAGGGEGAVGVGVYKEHYNDYYVTETGIDASATMIIPLMGLADEDPITDPPTATVRTIYVGYDMAIIEVRQSRYGSAAIRFSADTAKFPGATVQSDSLGMVHRITLNNLNGATTYYFDALIASIVGNTTPTAIKDKEDAYFKFTTLKTPPGDAEITNVKICNVTSDTAEIFWYTPNGSYDSRVVYDTRRPPTANVHDGNIYGRPTQFHYVKIGGLKEKTTYYFYVESNGTHDDNGGQYYTFTTPVEHVEFDVRLLKYSDIEFGLNIVNQDVKDYDSLELRFYVRGPDSVMNTSGSAGMIKFEDHIGIRLDIGIKYRADAYQGRHFKGDVDSMIQATRVVRMDDTYDPTDGTWAYYVRVPMDTVRMESGSRFRIDLSFRQRDVWKPHDNLLTTPPAPHILDLIWKSWSFTSHSRAAGDPADYPGIPDGGKDDIDNTYWTTPVNQYVAIYRKEEFVWGYSPSAKELQTKKTHYEMTSQITSPIFNPAEEYYYIEQLRPTIAVQGWAEITENGVINDIWVNGAKLSDVSSAVRYDKAADRWNLNIPVPMKNTYGGNNIDITLFGGPEDACSTCYGCAFTNHSFYVEFRGVEPFPSSMKLINADDTSAEVKDSAEIDGSTRFYVYLDDMNGNANKERRDTVWVSIVNPSLNDSIYIPLVETGIATGEFMSVSPITVVSVAPYQRGPNEISMDNGQTITVVYIDPTDFEDISRISLSSRAIEPYASFMKLIDAKNREAEVKDSARIDGSTSFYIHIVDMNANVNRTTHDTVWVSVANPARGDSVIIPLIETGVATGQFESAVALTVVNTAPSQRGPNEISMGEGQTIIVTYVDPVYPDDISRILLASRAEFAVPLSAYFRDSTGIGSIDLVYVKYSKAFAPDSLPDSLHLTIPGRAAAVKVSGAAVTLDANDKSLVRFYLGRAAITDVTGFGAGEEMAARSFLRTGDTVRQAFIPVVQDNAGPVLLSRALLYEKAGGGNDTVQVIFSEPVRSGQLLGSSLILLKNGVEYPLTVERVIDTSLTGDTLTLLVSSAGIIIGVGDSARINPAGPAADRAGNKAHWDNRPVPVELKSLSPRIVAGFYKDLNADGIIDYAEFKFSKPLAYDGLYDNIYLSWEGGPYTAVERTLLTPLGRSGADITGVGVDVGAMGLVGNTIATGGSMRVRAAHDDFTEPGDTLRYNLSDSAAPVIVSAVFYPGREKSQDSLVVTFSEPLIVVQGASSFKFSYTQNGVPVEYGISVQNKNMKSLPSSVQAFWATVSDTARFPSRGDSIWINPDVAVLVLDTSFNSQENERNRRAPLIVKPAPMTFTVVPAPNPFNAGANGGKVRVILKPDKVRSDLYVTGKVVIYDRMGNPVRADALDTLEVKADADKRGQIYYEWDGTSNRGRRMGTGTYVITVSIEYGYPGEKEKMGPEKGRALLYMLR